MHIVNDELALRHADWISETVEGFETRDALLRRHLKNAARAIVEKDAFATMNARARAPSDNGICVGALFVEPKLRIMLLILVHKALNQIYMFEDAIALMKLDDHTVAAAIPAATAHGAPGLVPCAEDVLVNLQFGNMAQAVTAKDLRLAHCRNSIGLK
jgi:hypothetical protein